MPAPRAGVLSAQGDSLSGANGNDVIFGDYRYLDTGADATIGGDDTLWGGSGNDTLDGGAGNDIVRGDEGEDYFIFSKEDGDDTVKDLNLDDDTVVQMVFCL